MTPYPLLFDPILREKVWGGRRLAGLGKDLGSDPSRSWGESWELADLPASIPGGRSVIANGPLRGHELRAILELYPEFMGQTSLTPEGGFPLLIKYLDARENLSVQVHPDAAYAAKHPDAHLKSEAWIVLDAEPGAVIYKGIRPGVTPEAFESHIKDGSVVDDLIAVPARRGDCHYLPSGTCHALGAGVLVAEVQTPSDTTFRVFDWGRSGRELHIPQSLECISFAPTFPESPQPPIVMDGLEVVELIRTEHFALEQLTATAATVLPIVLNDRPEVWMILEGEVSLRTEGETSTDIGRGATVLLPAALRDCEAVLTQGACVLRVLMPDPSRGLIA